MWKQDVNRGMWLSRWDSAMPDKHNSEDDADQSLVYQIRIKGHLSQKWTKWFEGLIITLEENGDTLLTGTVIDQAELHGILKKVRDLGMPLLSVNPTEQDLQSGDEGAHE